MVVTVPSAPAVHDLGSLRAQLQARAEGLRAELAGMEAKRQELEQIERMLEVSK
jgi:hypothetical protein